MKKPGFIITVLALAVLGVYLFVTAPPPLPDDAEAQATDPAGTIDIKAVLRTVAAENDVVRSLYTRELVGKGPAVGLQFDELWRDEAIEAGPLPALFLREAAGSIQRSSVPLSLFLGSDFPISPSNRFVGTQADMFEEIKASREPRFFYAEDTGQYTAMFPDFSSAPPCVTCHNEHPESPKTDWQIDDVMGATTWGYPRGEISYPEFLEIISALRQGFRDAYQAYLDEARSFENPPEIGDKWPADGYFLPSLEVFMEEFKKRASQATMDHLLAASGATQEDDKSN